MSSAAAPDRPPDSTRSTGELLRWIASEPFRVFFLSGALWSMVAAVLWPLFYTGKLSFYPSVAHARIMIEAFGGAFVLGFLGTAGPRILSAPRLTGMELALLFGLHQANAICHLRGQSFWGDAFFAALLVSLAGSLMIRFARFAGEPPPPALILALAGLASGVAGALLFMAPSTITDPARYRLAGLLLYQGFLLAPVLGIGSFFFPRILGGEFGEAKSPEENRRKWVRALNAALLLAASFAIEVRGHGPAGMILRVVAAAGYLLLEVGWWKRGAGDAGARGSVANGTIAALVCGAAGLLLAARFYSLHVFLEHLLYAGGFGLLMLMVSSRVLFGHSGELERFARRSWLVRTLVFLGILAAVTRASTGFLPHMLVNHHIYAAITWVVVVALWLIWHRRRFVTREPD